MRGFAAAAGRRLACFVRRRMRPREITGLVMVILAIGFTPFAPLLAHPLAASLWPASQRPPEPSGADATGFQNTTVAQSLAHSLWLQNGSAYPNNVG